MIIVVLNIFPNFFVNRHISERFKRSEKRKNNISVRQIDRGIVPVDFPVQIAVEIQIIVKGHIGIISRINGIGDKIIYRVIGGIQIIYIQRKSGCFDILHIQIVNISDLIFPVIYIFGIIITLIAFAQQFHDSRNGLIISHRRSVVAFVSNTDGITLTDISINGNYSGFIINRIINTFGQFRKIESLLDIRV